MITYDCDQNLRVQVSVAPTQEPLDLVTLRKHLEIGSTDSTHDAQLVRLMRAAQDQWEHDTDSKTLTQTVTQTLDGFRGECIRLGVRPIQSVTSIVYYDAGNAQQTLAGSVYSLDALERKVRLKYQQVWPVTIDRWDAVTVTYVVGYTSVPLVPEVAKHAMLLLIGYYFENRDLMSNEIIYSRSAYTDLVKRYLRNTYP